MPNNSPFVVSVNELLAKLEDSPTVDTGIELANQIVSLFGDVHTKSVEDVFESSIELPNAERYDSWFQPHPIFKSDRACFDLADSPLLQAKFYWLKKRSRQIIAGGVHFTPNYEDEEFTHNERYKVGLDFFLSPNGKSLQVVLSNRGNLRIVELAGRLNNTQKEIFEKWLGAGSLHTQEALHTTLWESFKLKSVNQKFYDGVSNSFTELLQHLKSIDKDEEEAKLFASRLLGRLLFCWFLRKKGIIDESIGYFNTHGADATAHYKQSLERLFFLTLNTPIDERDELTKQHQKALFPELLVDDQPSLFKTDQKTPYLNGGLFEPHENDWYKDDSLTLPEGFFTNLYDHFEEFNFTTDESSPEYEQIAIDPEMLGRVFESLLATQLEESGEQARKAKGAFYTPREIVSYMCKESLRSYLFTANQTDERYKKAINDLLDTSDREWAGAGTNSKRDSVPKEYRIEIIETLDSVTVIDPACGSGAFPMGMVQLLNKTYERLESRFDPYKTKLHIIQNSIFGVDIEPMAVEIARLRAWLSLIVDEEDARDVEPLPNLDFKFVCSNSLIPLNEELGLFSDTSLHQKLKDIRTKYFNARKPHTKKALQDAYHNLIKSEQTSLITDDARTRQLKTYDPFNNSQPSEFFDADQMFGVDKGFSIVIGNPPYVRADSPNFKKQRMSILASGYYETLYEKWDLFVPFIEQGLKLLGPQGTLSYITSNSLFTSKFAFKILDYIQANYQTIFIDYFDDKTKVFDAGVVPVVFGISKSQTESKVRKVAHKGRFGIIEKKELIDFSDFQAAGKDAFKASSVAINIATQFQLLGNICYMSKGMVINSDEKKAKGEFKKNDLISKTRTNIHSKEYIEGKDLTRYLIKKQSKYLEWDTDRVPSKLSRPTFPELYSTPKIMRGRVTGGVVDESGIVCNDSIVLFARFIDLDNVKNNSLALSIKKNNDKKRTELNDISSNFNIRYLLAILNSKFAYYYLNSIRRHRLKDYFYPDDFRKLPIPVASKAQQENVSNLVRKVENLPLGQPERKKLLDSIDQLIYQLFGISSEDIAIIENDFSNKEGQ